MAVLPMADTLDTCCTCLCDCVRHVNSERKRMRSLVMTVMERLEMEEKMNQETKRKGEKEMADLMMKLATLQKSLLSEQLRVKTLLNNKDIIIRSLTHENRKLSQKLKNVQKLETSEQISGNHSDSSSSGELINRDTENGDKVGDEVVEDMSSSVDSQSDQSVIQLINDDQSVIMMMPSDYDHHTIDDLSQIPQPNNSKERIIDNKTTENEALQYVIVSDNLSEPNLVVLDNTANVDDDNIVMSVSQLSSSRSSVIQMSQTRAALRQMTNHRSAIKPSDIKHRDRVKTVHKEQKTLLSYWSDSFL